MENKEVIFSKGDVLNFVLIGHQVNTPNIELTVKVNGSRYVIAGKSNLFLPSVTDSVELLDANCTPDKPIISETALKTFSDAVYELVVNNKEFSTCLRTMWNSPVLTWKVKT
jgi:hypothetical protein